MNKIHKKVDDLVSCGTSTMKIITVKFSEKITL